MSKVLGTFRRPLTTADAVQEEIRRKILSGELRPGSPVRQEEFAVLLGVSRVPIREALSVLAAEGVLTYKAYAGYSVTVLEQSDLVEIQQLLALLEDEALRKAVENIDAPTFKRLQDRVKEIDDDSVQIIEFLENYEGFRFEIIEAARMPRLTELVRSVWKALDTYRLAWLSDEQARKLTQRSCHEVLDGLAERDMDRVVGAMREHRIHAHRQLSEIVLRANQDWRP